MSKYKISALQGFSIDEITMSSHGPLVALTLNLPTQSGGGKTQDIDVALSLEQSLALGKKIVELSTRLQSGLH